MDVYSLIKDKADKVVDRNDKEHLILFADIAKSGADIYLERMKSDYENGKKLEKDESKILSDIKTECLIAKIDGKILKLKYKIFGENCLHFDFRKERKYL